MLKFLLIIPFFFLSGCREQHCIQPNDTGIYKKLDVVSTQQKWVDSRIEISGGVKVTEIDITPSKLNFCINQHTDFLVQSGKSEVKLPFELKAGDIISFSIVRSKMCKDKGGKERYIKIDENCDKEETEYFANILNEKECKNSICPNKYTLNGAKWLNGKEYWNNNMKGGIESILTTIKYDKSIDCNRFFSDKASKIDTYILNFTCRNICNTGDIKNCVQVESLNKNEELFAALNDVLNDDVKIAKLIKEFKEEGVGTYIPSLVVDMEGENFRHSYIRTNYDYKIETDHSKGENLAFTLGNGKGSGGYNMRVTKNIDSDKNLYIHVTADGIPDHKPGENHEDDISVDISKVDNFQYMEGLVKRLNQKVGKVYYGIRDHGCGYKNEGEFSINITTKELPIKTFSMIYNFFDKGIKEAFFSSNYKNNKTGNDDLINSYNETSRGESPTRRLYNSFIASNRTTNIRSTIIALLILSIILYALYYFFGLSHVSIYEFLIICVKIGVVAQLLQDNSWNFFYNNAFSLFVNAPNQLMKIVYLKDTDSYIDVFEVFDLPLHRFLSPQSLLLIVSLIFSGPLGIVAFCLVIWGLIIVVLSIFNALFSFITYIVIIALLLSLAPIFIICALFKYTRQIFLRWIGYLARFAIHPVLLLIFISFISQIMNYIVYSIFNFEACSECLLSIPIYKVFSIPISDYCIMYGYAAKHAPNITAIMAFVILGHAMKAMVDASSEISDTLFSNYVPNEYGKQYQQSLMGVVGLDQESVQRREMRKRGSGGISHSSSADAVIQRPQIPQRPNEK